MTHITRRAFTALAAGALVAGRTAAQGADAPLITRAIPSTGERMPVVGLGTSQVFADNNAETRDAAANVIRTLVAADGRLIDTASVYQDAELVIGDVVSAGSLRDKVFVATKLEEPDESELRRSLSRLKTAKIDMLQLHNVNDPNQSLAQFRAWKAQGICRYVGITSTYHGSFPAVEAVLAREKPDFVQIDYSIDDREAERRILPIAAEAKAGVLTALPFGRARLFRAVSGKAVPDWARGLRAKLGAVLSQVPARRSARHGCHSRYQQRRAHGRQSRRAARHAAQPRATQTDGRVCRKSLGECRHDLASEAPQIVERRARIDQQHQLDAACFQSLEPRHDLIGRSEQRRVVEFVVTGPSADRVIGLGAGAARQAADSLQHLEPGRDGGGAFRFLLQELKAARHPDLQRIVTPPDARAFRLKRGDAVGNQLDRRELIEQQIVALARGATDRIHRCRRRARTADAAAASAPARRRYCRNANACRDA